jgi:hypothetical protein
MSNLTGTRGARLSNTSGLLERHTLVRDSDGIMIACYLVQPGWWDLAIKFPEPLPDGVSWRVETIEPLPPPKRVGLMRFRRDCARCDDHDERAEDARDW